VAPGALELVLFLPMLVMKSNRFLPAGYLGVECRTRLGLVGSGAARENFWPGRIGAKVSE
jgi:hypothetical protein